MLQKFAMVKYGVFVAKICKHTLCASNVGYLAVAASTLTSATLADEDTNPITTDEAKRIIPDNGAI